MRNFFHFFWDFWKNTQCFTVTFENIHRVSFLKMKKTAKSLALSHMYGFLRDRNMIHSWSWSFFGCRNFCYVAEISASKTHHRQKRFFQFFVILCRNFYTYRNFWQKFLRRERHHALKFSIFFLGEIGHFHKFRLIWIRTINVFFLGGVIFTYPNWHWRAEMRAGSKICLSTKLYIIFLWKSVFVSFL